MFFAMLFCGEKAWYTETDNSEFNELNTANTQEVFMNYECKITVLETKVFPELQEKY